MKLGMTLLLMISAAWSSSAQETGGGRSVRSPLQVLTVSETSVVGFTPAQIRKAYGFDQIANRGAGQVIGIVIPFDDNRIEQDLAVFSSTFNLPACTSLNGCFRKIFSTEKNPGTKAIWTLETALDVEWAHAIAPEAQILLVEAPSDDFDDMLNAVDVAVHNGANVVSMSWGVPESADELSNDNHFQAAGVIFVAASGNTGNPGFYPAASPFVVSVGGTRLNIDASGNYISESAWSGSGGGLSPFESRPAYQSSVNTLPQRGIPDVAYDADPATGFAVYSSHPIFGFKGWFQLGGTSAAAPQWAGLLAIANSLRLAGNKLPLAGPGVLYGVASPTNYNDITTGSNGACTICTAGAGYDFVTGLGSPKAAGLIPALVGLQ